MAVSYAIFMVALISNYKMQAKAASVEPFVDVLPLPSGMAAKHMEQWSLGPDLGTSSWEPQCQAKFEGGTAVLAVDKTVASSIVSREPIPQDLYEFRLEIHYANRKYGGGTGSGLAFYIAGVLNRQPSLCEPDLYGLSSLDNTYGLGFRLFGDTGNVFGIASSMKSPLGWLDIDVENSRTANMTFDSCYFDNKTLAELENDTVVVLQHGNNLTSLSFFGVNDKNQQAIDCMSFPGRVFEKLLPTLTAMLGEVFITVAGGSGDYLEIKDINMFKLVPSTGTTTVVSGTTPKKSTGSSTESSTTEQNNKSTSQKVLTTKKSQTNENTQKSTAKVESKKTTEAKTEAATTKPKTTSAVTTKKGSGKKQKMSTQMSMKTIKVDGKAINQDAIKDPESETYKQVKAVLIAQMEKVYKQANIPLSELDVTSIEFEQTVGKFVASFDALVEAGEDITPHAINQTVIGAVNDLMGVNAFDDAFGSEGASVGVSRFEAVENGALNSEPTQAPSSNGAEAAKSAFGGKVLFAIAISKIAMANANY